MRLEALEVGFEISCTGSGAPELSEAVADAWDGCLVDSLHQAEHLLTVVLEDDQEELAELAPGSQLFGSDLPTVMDRLSPLVTRLAAVGSATPALTPRPRRRPRCPPPPSRGCRH